MEIKYQKKFLKDLSKIPTEYRTRMEKLVFEIIPKEDIQLIMRRVSRLKGHENSFKIRVGDYRIGLYMDGEVLEFKRVLHRKEIYRYFP